MWHYVEPIRSDELYHHGTKGMHWGVRRWQYEDGTYTPAGRIHYGIGQAKDAVKKAIGYQKVGNEEYVMSGTLADKRERRKLPRSCIRLSKMRF